MNDPSSSSFTNSADRDGEVYYQYDHDPYPNIPVDRSSFFEPQETRISISFGFPRKAKKISGRVRRFASHSTALS